MALGSNYGLASTESNSYVEIQVFYAVIPKKPSRDNLRYIRHYPMNVLFMPRLRETENGFHHQIDDLRRLGHKQIHIFQYSPQPHSKIVWHVGVSL